MTKEELEQLFSNLDIDANEGITSDEVPDLTEITEDLENATRCVYWDYNWQPISASGNNYDTLVTYQISFFSFSVPRNNEKLKSFINELNKRDIQVNVSHEYIVNSKTWHSFFALEILESIF